LLVLLAVAIYLVRHYLRVYRAEDPACGGCSGCCLPAGAETRAPGTEGTDSKDRSCGDRTAQDCESKIRAGKPTPQGSLCQDMKTRDHEVCH
jgi:hypothetical protein